MTKNYNNMDLLNAFKVINSIDPSNPQDLVTLQYLQTYVAGIRDPKDACRVTTAGSNVILAGSAPSTLDGITLIVGDRILVRNQTTATENGIYTVTTLGTGVNGTWSRSSDASTSAQVTSGLFTFITNGTINAYSGWLLTTNDPIVLGTSSLTFSQINGLADVIAGVALVKTGNQLDVQIDNVTIQTNGSNQLKVHGSYVGQVSITTLGVITTGTWNGTTIAIANGGTGSTTANGARVSLGAAASGSNGDITSLTGLTTALSVSQGGTGATTAAGARNNIGAIGKYPTTITSGQATYNITHNLGTLDILPVQIYEVVAGTTPSGVVTQVIDLNTVQLQFGIATAVNHRVIISG